MEVPYQIFRNDWGRVSPPELGTWTPTMKVSVIIPAYNCQERLDLALAALSRQTYPAELLEVVVVDDGSSPLLELPKIRPARCKIVRAQELSGGWGQSNARHVGARESSGDILHWLDADMVAFPDHVEAQARWHHLLPDAVTLGYKRFVGTSWTTPEEVLDYCASGAIGQLFPYEETEPHDYVEKIIDESDGLRAGNHLNFLAYVGATAALRRLLYEATGGFDCTLRLGEDTEFGYRLAQAGAVFIPEPQARSWHMGPSSMMRNGEHLRRYNQPFLADLMPYPRWLRQGANRTWSVPLVKAVVHAEDHPLELVRTCVDRLLASDETDLQVHLVGSWDALTDERRRVLDDPLVDQRLIATTYRADPRVVLTSATPASAYPSPYLLKVPVQLGVGETTIRRLVEEADRWQAGLVRVLPVGAGSATVALELWRTAALSRAARVCRPNEHLADAVTHCYGSRWVSGEDFSVTDLSALTPGDLTSPKPRRAADKPPARVGRQAVGRRKQATVEVGGVRSLVRAAVFVAGLIAEETRRRLRRTLRRR